MILVDLKGRHLLARVTFVPACKLPWWQKTPTKPKQEKPKTVKQAAELASLLHAFNRKAGINVGVASDRVLLLSQVYLFTPEHTFLSRLLREQALHGVHSTPASTES